MRVLSISSARQRLSALFQTVTGQRNGKVVIASRGNDRRAVLVGETYFNKLQSAAKRLQKLECRKAVRASAFKLVGSGRITAGGDDPVTDLRAEERARINGRVKSLR